ncbi:MAG: thiamine diphosphokinase [Chloroflexota bacterium]|nr:MAG: thiamine diphosphokinase [Chloroflexota bacterium]
MIARRSLVLADGAAPTRAGLDAAWPGWAEGIDLVVAADGGARLAGPLGLSIDRWVGDGDSLGPEGVEALRVAGVPVELASTDKEETDTELGLLAAIAIGAAAVTILGALGGPRVDHELANVQLLAHPAAAGVPVELLHDGIRIRLLSAPAATMAAEAASVRLELAGRTGDVVSLIPLVDAAGVTTSGLRYPLSDAVLRVGPARGVSNVRDQSDAWVRIRSGRLLVAEVPATLPE